jgi:hypothetical protein
MAPLLLAYASILLRLTDLLHLLRPQKGCTNFFLSSSISHMLASHLRAFN